MRPCLLKKTGKGTVRKWAQTACATVPFEKISQRHGQNRSEAVVPDRAFWKKVAKARSERGRKRRVRPCLLKKLSKGTVRKWAQTACVTVPFAKISQRHGQKILVRPQKARVVERKAPPASVRSRPSADDLYKKEARLRRASIDMQKAWAFPQRITKPMRSPFPLPWQDWPERFMPAISVPSIPQASPS